MVDSEYLCFQIYFLFWVTIAFAATVENKTEIQDEKAVVQKRGLGLHGYGNPSGLGGGIIIPSGHFPGKLFKSDALVVP